MHRFTLEETERRYTSKDPTTDGEVEWKRRFYAETPDAQAMAGFLRATADKLDPPKDRRYE